tara:strand:- start:92 stop:457 length:366 start_codon:yes stop_codon:yes gene_type:complete
MEKFKIYQKQKKVTYNFWGTKKEIQEVKEYIFLNFNDALKFALNEQISKIYVLNLNNKQIDINYPFKTYLKVNEFINRINKNPQLFGLQNCSLINHNLERYYYVLIQRDFLNKLMRIYKND